MKLYKDVLSPVTLSFINSELSSFMATPEKWTCSSFIWNDDIKVNISGGTLITMVGDSITKLILEDLDGILPSMSHQKLQYCVWPSNSGISTHNDKKYKFGATIYLNESWDINDGGIFLYEHAADDWRAHVPKFNTMMVNDSSTLHLVTPVSPFAKQNRYTIQIFGDLRNE